MIPVAGGFYVQSTIPHVEELLTEIVHRLLAIEEKLNIIRGEEE